MSEEEELFSQDEWEELIAEMGIPPRQSEVLDRVIRGDTDQVISRRLDIAEPTVRPHIKKLFNKFGVGISGCRDQHRSACVLLRYRWNYRLGVHRPGPGIDHGRGSRARPVDCHRDCRGRHSGHVEDNPG